MADDEAALQEKRAELKQVINDGLEKTFPAYFFNAVGRRVVRILGLNKMPHWTINALVLGVLAFLPGILVSVATKEIYHWEKAHLLAFGLVVFAYLAPIVSHVNVVYNVLPGIRDGLVNAIESVEDLKKLQSWLSTFWSFPKWLLFMITAGIILGTVMTVGFSLSLGSFIGFGLTVVVFSIFPFFAIPLFVIVYMLTLPSQLAGFRLNLYESDPANSEVVQRLIYIFNVYIYILAGYIAIATALFALNAITVWLVYVVIAIGWVPTIMQFLINQYSTRKIIISAKWNLLNRLQTEIKELQGRKLRDVPDEIINRINQLMDLHDRIGARPNSILNWGTGLSFLNQLMLPLLGVVLGNIDKLIKLIPGTP